MLPVFDVSMAEHLMRRPVRTNFYRLKLSKRFKRAEKSVERGKLGNVKIQNKTNKTQKKRHIQHPHKATKGHFILWPRKRIANTIYITNIKNNISYSYCSATDE